jgi:D-serine deaminase-like pyridoxal phosphate-dependent protein
MRVPEIDTPALVVDLERMERNIATMARFFASRPAKLRPHFKTPKCAEVVQRQLAAGAIGVTCAKLGEAEALAASGVRTSVLIANELVGPAKLARLVALAKTLPELIVAVDSAAQVDAPTPRSRLLGARGRADRGRHRHAPLRHRLAEESVALARRIAASRATYRGIMG